MALFNFSVQLLEQASKPYRIEDVVVIALPCKGELPLFNFFCRSKHLYQKNRPAGVQTWTAIGHQHSSLKPSATVCRPTSTL
jgi:hypothetical protein